MQSFCASVCLLAFLSGQPGVAPELLGLFAEADGSHQVIVSEGATAGGELILHHSLNCLGPLSQHRHGLTARLLVLLADSSNRDPDHVLRFNACHVLLRSDPEKVKRHETTAQSVGLALRREAMTLPYASPSASQPSRPHDSALLSSLHSTVLLI